MTSLLAFNSFRFSNQGFSFIGLIMIILVMAVFTSAIFLSIPPSDATSAVAITMQRASILQSALKKYKVNNVTTAGSLADLVTSTGVPCTVETNSSSTRYKLLKGWCGPYLDQPIAATATAFKTDGWGVLFQYDGVNLKSCGPDRTCGNADDISFHDF